MEEEKRTCVECRYFIQHYTRPKDQKYMATDCGHCSNPRLRAKKPGTPACQRFEKK